MKNMIWAALLLGLGGCSKGFQAPLSLGSGIQSAGGELVLLPPTDKIDSNCASSSDYDTCLFLKNPVLHANRTFSGFSASQLDPYQTLGVKLTGLSTSGFLENSDFIIQTAKSPRLAVTQNAPAKFRYSTALASQIEQLTTYYYFRLANEFWGARGPLAVRGKALKVVVDSDMSGFEKSTDTIHLLKNSKSWPMALDASQSLYLLATANIHYATSGRINNLAAADPNHQFCGSDAKGCCKTEAGCARALVSGLSTYFVASMFPMSPAIGELSANRLGGVRLCAVRDRDLSAAATLTKSTAFSSCATRRGDVHIMGQVYASVFWEVKKAVPAEATAVDRLYLEHLSTLGGDDTFLTAKAKLFSLNSVSFPPSLRAAFTAEFSRRGI